MTLEQQENILKQLGNKETKYDYSKPDAKILETFENKHLEEVYLVPFTQNRDEFTSLCPVTNQPDQAKIEIIYIPKKKMIESKSLKLYLFSFRNSGEFHEDVINRIANDFFRVAQPYYLRVFGDFSQRGGIAIKPIVERWEVIKMGFHLKENIERLVNMWDRKNAR